VAYSGQRKIAFDAGFNDALFGRDRNNPYKKSIVRGSWCAYEDGYENGLLSDVPPRGPAGEQGEAGEPGPTGSQGSTGAAGAAGATGAAGAAGADGADGVDTSVTLRYFLGQ